MKVELLKAIVDDRYNDFNNNYAVFAEKFYPELEPKDGSTKVKNDWRSFRDYRSPKGLWINDFPIEKEWEERVKEVLDKSKRVTMEIGGMEVESSQIKSMWYNGANWCASIEKENFDMGVFRDELLSAISAVSIELPAPSTMSDKTLLVFSLPDLHIGKRPFDEIADDVLVATTNLLDRIDFSKKEYHILFVMGNDLLNSDFNYATTKGTPQFDYVEWAQSFKDAVSLVKGLIDILQTYATVDIINVPGNHDFKRGFYVGQVIKEYYKDGFVDADENPRKYYKFGRNLLGFDHGELKFSEYPLLMVREKPLMYAETDNWEWFLGHQHTEKVDEVKGFKMRFLPSLTRHNDEWHVRNGYIGNKRSAIIYKYDYYSGLIGTEVYTFKP